MTAGPATQSPPWLEVALLRQGLYRLLAGSLLPPTVERTDALGQAATVLDGMGVDEFPFAGPVRSLLEALHRPWDHLTSNIEHVRLFESGVDGALCPPTESYYLEDAVGTVIGNLQRDCLQLGLTMRRDGGLEPDHVSALLEVQSALCAREAEAWIAGDVDAVARAVRDERWFLERHLARWVTAFTKRLGRAEALSPFRQAGPALEAVVRSDRHLLDALDVRAKEVTA